MNKRSKNALDDYFTSMLAEEEDCKTTELLTIEKPQPTTVKPLHIPLSTLPEILVFEENPAEVPAKKEWKNIEVADDFQALFFRVADVIFAVPLMSLGGIHELTERPNKILGKPSWFTGVLTYQKKLFNIVDTANWLNRAEIKKIKEYSHYICLENSIWGLGCEELIGAQVIKKSQVKWRLEAGRNPWLSGIVKSKKCVLLHVPELINLLEKGQDINDLTGLAK